MSMHRPMYNPFGFLIAAAAGLLHRNNPAPLTADAGSRPVRSRFNSGGCSSGYRNGDHPPSHWRHGSRSGRFSCFLTRTGHLHVVRRGKLYRDPMFV